MSTHDDRHGPGTNGPDPIRVRLDGMGGLVASLPALLGFTPTESLVVITMRREGGRTRVGAMLRTDLPTDAAEAREMAAMLRRWIARVSPPAITLVVVAEGSEGGQGAAVAPGRDGTGAPDLPHRAVVDALTPLCDTDGVELTQAVWTPRIAAGTVWRCYFRCRCDGVVSDPRASEVAAHSALAGRVTYRTREEAAAALAADADAEHPQRRASIDAAHASHRAARDPWNRADPRHAGRADVDVLRRAAATVGRGEVPDAVTLARAVAALRDPAVRDVALGFTLGADPAVDPQHATALWWTLTRWAPAPEVAEPATLLAVAALTSGGSAALTVALERAQVADPAHQLSRLVGALVEQVGQPQQVTDVLRRAAAEAARHLGL